MAGSILGALGLSVSLPAAQTDLYWDPAGTLPTTGGGTQTWDTSALFWYNPTLTMDQAWDNSLFATANFGGTAGLVTLGAPITAVGVNFNTTGYTVTGNGANPLTLATGTSGLAFPTIGVTSANLATISAVLAGTEGFYKTGTGTLRLSGANTITNGIVINEGTLAVGASGALNGNLVTLLNTGDLQLSGTSVSVGGLTGVTATFVENVSATAATLTLAGTGTTNYAGLIQNGTGAGSLSLSLASGTQALSGNNTYSGGTTLAAGATLNINNAGTGATNSAIGTGTFTVNGGTIDNTSAGAVVLATNNPVSLAGNLTFGGTQNLTFGTGAVTLTANRTITTNGTGTLAFGGAVGGATFNLNKAGSGGLTLTGVVGTTTGGVNVTGGTLTLTNTGNTFTGAVTVDGAGSVLAFPGNAGGAGDPTALGSGSKNVTLTNGGAVSPTSFSNPTSTNTKSFVIGAGGGTFNVGNGIIFQLDDATQFSGTGDLTVTGAGTGTVFLNSQAYNGFTGNAIVNSGTLKLGNANSLGNTATKIITVNTGGAVDVNAAVFQPITLSGGSLIESATAAILPNAVTLTSASTIGATGTVLLTLNAGVTGTGNLTVNNTSTGGTTFATASVNNSGQLINSGAGTGTTTVAILGANITGLQQTGNSPLTITAAVTPSAVVNPLTNSGAGLLTLTGGYTGGTGTNNLTFNANSTGGITVGTVPVTGTVTNSGTGAGTTTITGSVSPSVPTITENSTTSPLTITGITTVATGGTTLVNNNASGTAVFTAGAITGTGNLILNNNSAIGTPLTTVGGTTGGLTLNGVVTNTGSLTNSGTGSGPVYITGAVGTVTAINQNSTTSPLVITGGTTGTVTGTVTIVANSTLQLGNQAANNLALGTGIIADAGTLIFAPGTGALVYPNVINGAGNVTVNGLASAAPASIALTSTTGNFTGSYTLNQGRLLVVAQSNLGSGTTAPITVNGNSATLTGGQLLVNAAVAIGNAITLNGYGPTEALGNLGAIRLSAAASSYTGAILLGSNASINTQNAAATLTSTAIISGGSTAQLMIGTPISGTGLGNIGGTLTINSVNTYTGGTLISGQTAALGAVGALGTGPVIVGSSATQTSSGLTESVANALTGTQSLTVNGGTSTLSQLNNYSGGTTVAGGTLTVSAANALGTGTLSITGGTFNAGIAGVLNPGFQPTLNQSGGTVNETVINAFSSAINLNLTGGITNLSSANNYTGGAAISGTNVTNVSAAGGLAGVTTVSGGGVLSSNLAVGLSQGGNIFLNSGGILSSAIAGGAFQDVVANSGSILNPGGVGIVGGPLTVTNLTTASGTVLQFDTTAPASTDLLSLAGNVSIASGTAISLSYLGQTPTVSGTYKLIQYAGAAPSLANFTLPTAPQGLTYALSTGIDAGFIDLTVSGNYAGIFASWLPTAAASFSWNTPANWDGGVVPKLAGDLANFNSALAGAQTVTVDGLQHVGTLTLFPAAAFAYTVAQGTAGSTIYLDNNGADATINNLAQNNTITAPIVLLSANTNVDVGGGTQLALSGTTSGTGKLTVAGGTGTLLLNGTGAWTGGTEIDSQAIVVIPGTFATNITPLNNGGLGVTTLNGGTLSFTNASGTTANPTTGFVLNFGLNGGTVNLAPATNGTNGKVFSNATGLFTGAGTFTKTGGGDFQISGPSIGFTGSVNANGLLELQNVAALGFGTTAGFNGGTITVNGTGEIVVSGSVQIFNPITLAGGVLSANGATNNGIFNSTVTVSAPSTLRASLFQGTGNAQNFAINTLAGSGNLSVLGSTTTNAIGLVTLGSASTYTGTITIGANGALGIGSGANFFGSPNPIAVSTVTSGIGLVADGDGTGSPQTIAFTLPANAINFVAGNTTGYIVGKQGASTLFNQSANKTISLATALPYNNTSTLNVQPFNGYGLLLTAQPNLAATTTFSVGSVGSVGQLAPAAQASNVVPGLTLTNLAGAFGITKIGVGTLQLGTSAGDTGNSFGTGTATAINVTGGVVSAFADANLGSSSNGITLNNTTLAEFLALNTFTLGSTRTITIGSATGATIAVAGGQTLTLASGLAYSTATNVLNKAENGTLILAVPAAGTPTGNTTISAGALVISNSNQVGSGTITVANNVGAALQIAGGTFTQALSLNNSGIQGNGALEVTSGSPTISGTITAAAAANIGIDNAASTLTTGTITLTAALGIVGPGNLIVNTGFGTSTNSFTQYGSGLVTLNATGTTYGALTADAGTIKLAGTAVAGAGTTNANFGGTITTDDTGTNTPNRLILHSFNTLGSGNYNLLGNAGANSADAFLTFIVDRGQTNVVVTPGAATAQANLALTATGGTFTRKPFATALFASAPTFALAITPTNGAATINTGPITTAASFLGAGTAQTGTANIGILPWAVVNNNGSVTLATSTVIGASGYLRNLAANETVSTFQNYFNANAASTSSTLATVATTTTLTTNNNIASSLFVGESVSGTGVTPGTYITAISGNTITLSVVGGTAGTNVPITFGTTGTNLALTGASTGLGGTAGQAGTLAQAINSLTLNNNATLTLPNSNTVLTIANSTTLGGAVLAIGSNTISGGQITGGSAGGELIVQAAGNITINSAIVGGATGAGAGLTKGQAGTLTLGGTAFYNGQTVVNAGTLNLNNGGNTIQFANFMNLGSGATLQLNGNTQFVTDLLSDNAGVVGGLGTVGSNSTITGSAGATIVIKGDGTSRAFTGTIGGSVGLLRATPIGAPATWTLTQNQTFAAPAYIAGGTVVLQNAGAFSNATALTIAGALTLDNTGSTDSSTRLPSGLGVTMDSGALNYVGRVQYASAETVGVVTSALGQNTVSVTQQTIGVSSATLTLSGLNRATGSVVNFANTGGTLGAIGSNPQIIVTGGTTGGHIIDAGTAITGGLSNGLIGGGYTVNGTDFAGYNPTYGVGALGSVGFAGYSPYLINNAGPTDNVSMISGTGIAINTQTINSLRVTGPTAINLNASQTLTLASGGLLASGNLTLGSVINQGSLTSGTGELFLLGGGTTTINSAITGSGVAVVRVGGTYTLAGTNTYDGGTYFNGGTTTLANAGNAATGLSTLGTGGIFINSGTFTQTAGSRIPAQALTINGTAILGTSAVNLTSNLALANSVTTFGSNIITVTNTNGIAVGQLVTGAGLPGNEFVTAVNPANNTVTITSGSGVTAGSASLTFLVNNTLTNLTFNNTGGNSNPTLAIAGLLNLPNGAITAFSSNPSQTSTLAGGNVDFGNAANPVITVNPITFNGQNIAPLQATLAISSVLQNVNNPLTVTGGGNLQLTGASVFTGGVNLASGTNLTIAANSNNSAGGQPLNGPLGTGPLTIGSGSTLYGIASAVTVGNSIVVTGNFGFDAPTNAPSLLTLGAGGQTIALPASTATTITVNAPNMTATLGGTVTGNGSTIVKAGFGTLQLSNSLGGASSFTGGVLLNSGTLTASGVGTGTTSLGTGPVTINGGVLQIRHSGVGNNGVITYANNVNISTSLANAYIDINNNGANTGNTLVFGKLDYGTVSGTSFTSTVNGNPAPGTILNVTGGNGYKLQFNGTTLTSSTSSATFNVGTGLFLILPGGFTAGTNVPVNIGPGTLSFSGNNGGAVTSPITGTTTVSPATGGSTTPLGTGGITLNNASTLQIAPVLGTLSAAGYTAGGTTAKYYSTGGSGLYVAGNYGVAPGSTLAGVNLSDRTFSNAPAGVNTAALANTLGVYQTLLTVTNPGTYYFGQGNDDLLNLTVDGQQVQNTGLVGQSALQAVNLTAGQHLITLRIFNVGGGGGGFVVYSGPDTATNGVTGQPPVNNIQALPLTALSYATNYTAANNYQNAAVLGNAITVATLGSATIDGLGSDFNYGIPGLNVGFGSTLVAANGAGTAVGAAGNGAFIVTGTTTVGATSTVSPTTATLVLAGGIADSGSGLTKTGAGNLILGPSTAFTGAFKISGGFVQLQDGAGLTTDVTTIGVATTTPATLDLNGQTVSTTGNIVLNGGAGPAGKSSATPAGLYNSSAATASLPPGSSLLIGAATATVNASIGGFGNINILGSIADSVAGSGLNKVGPDTLILSNTNTFTGVFNINGGTVQLTGPNGFTTGTASPVNVAAGATVDLNGQGVHPLKTLALNGAGQTGVGAPNQLGALVNSSAAPAFYFGPVTLAANTSIGGPSLAAGNGSIFLSGAITGAFQLTKIGGNGVFLTAAGAESNLDIQAGSVTLGGAGKDTATASHLVRQGATLNLDSSNGAGSNRLGGQGMFLTGTLNVTGISGTAVSELINSAASNINIGQANGVGQATITLNAASTAGVALQVASTSTSIFNRGAGSTALIRGDNLGGSTTATPTANTAQLLGNATSLGLGATNGQSVGQAGQWNAPNAAIYQWAVADTSAAGVGTGFAGYSTYGFALNFGTANSGGVAPISINANNGLATSPGLSALNVNTTNGNTTVTTGSTAGLSVGQLIAGTGLAANTVITAITNATTFSISLNATATANNTAVLYSNPVFSLSNFTPVAGTTVTVPSTAALYVGEVVTGNTAAGVASGNFGNGNTIASIISATQFTLTTAATAGASQSLNFSLPGYANIVSNTVELFGSASAAKEQNSLTFNGSGGATITTGLQLDSGGVLAVGSSDLGTTAAYTIDGTGVLTGTNTLNREMIFHVTGVSIFPGYTNTALTVNAPIFSNGGGLTKADGGTLVLGTAEPYLGNTYLDGGVTALAGGNNTLFMVYTTAPTPGNSTAGVTGQTLYVNNGATLDLNGTTQAVGNFLSGSGTQLSGGTVLNSNATAATLHVALNASQTWAGNLSNAAGVLNFVRDGNNTLTVNSPNIFGGSFTASGGATTLVDLGTFQNAPLVNVTRAALIWNDQGTQAVSNRLSPFASINLTGGGLQFLTRAGTGSNPTDAISLGTLNLGVGESNVVISSVGQGGAASVTFAGLGTRATGATLNFGNPGTGTGDNPRYFFTSAPTLVNGLIGGWATAAGLNPSTGSGNIAFATYDSVSGVRALQYQANATYGAGVNTILTASATIPGSMGVATTTTVNSLSLYNATLSFTNAFDTLVVQSGGILCGLLASANLGSTATPGQIMAGAGQDLYINNGGTAAANPTFTINSKILDNGSNTNVVFDGGAQGFTNTTTLTNANTYGGTTYLSGSQLSLNSLLGPAIPGNLVISGGTSASADSLGFNQTSVSWQLANQIAATANITMNGATQLNLGSGALGTGPNAFTVSNTQTINNLTINNDGGSNGGNGPTIFTGAGTLTINGTITATAATETFTIPALNGFYKLTTGNIVVSPNVYVPNQAGLAINGNITAPSLTLSGGGVLGIGGQSANFTGAVLVFDASTLIFSPTAGTVGPILGGQVNLLAANTTFDTRALSGVVGSIASSQSTAVVMNGVQGTAGTLTTGLDNASSSFAGTFFSPYPTGLLSVTKIGNGNLTVTNNSTATNNGTLTVNGGQFIVSDTTGRVGFTTTTLNTGGTVVLDDVSSAVDNRLGGQTLTATAATLAPTYRTINMQGGNLTVNGNGGTAVSEGLGNIASISGGGIITLNAASTGGVNVLLGQIAAQGGQTSLLIRGDSLGGTVGTNNTGANVATLRFSTAGAAGTAPGLGSLTGGSGANNTLIRSIRPDILVSSSATGLGDGFLVVDSVTGLVRPLNAATEEQATPTLPVGYTLSTTTTVGTTVTVGSTVGLVVGQTVTGTNIPANDTISAILSPTTFSLAAPATLAATVTGTYSILGTTQNVKTSAVTPLFANATVNSLTLGDGGGFTSGIVAGNQWGSNGGALTLTVTSTGILNTAGNNTIGVGAYGYGGVTADIHVLAGSTLTMNATPTGSAGGLTKAGGGLFVLNSPFFGNNAQTIAVNGGTLQLGANLGNNPLWVYINGSSAPSAENLAVNGGTFDLNGNNQLVGAVTSTNPLPYGGGTAASPNVIITNSSATTATFSTNAANSIFSGVFSGKLNLDKSGNTTMSLSSPQSYVGTTTIRGGNVTLRDQASLPSATAVTLHFAELILDNTGFAESTTRISATNALNFNGGALRINTTEAVDTQNFGTVNLNSGANLLYINAYNNNANSASPTFNVANLTQSSNATLNIDAPYSTSIGNYTAANAHVYISQLNGVPFSASNLANNIIAPWFVVGNPLNNAVQWASYSNTAGVTLLGTNGVPAFGTFGGGATVNANVGTVQNVAGQTLNTLAVINPAAAAVVGFNTPADQLVLGAGGLLLNDAGSKGIVVQGGSITAGNVNQASTLYFHAYAGANTINSPFVNNGTGALTLVRDGNATVTLTPLVGEAVTFAIGAPATSTLTLPNASGLVVGMGVSGSLITAGTTITAINGNVITLSAATAANAATTAVTNQLSFSPVQSTATGTTTAGTNTVTVLAANIAGGFVPAVGQVVGSSVNLPGGDTITNVALNAGVYTLTLANPATTSSATATLVFNALNNTYSGGTIVSAANDQFAGGTTNLSGLPGAIVVPGNLTINGSATVTMVTNQGQLASNSNVTINGSGILNFVGTNTVNSVSINNSGGNTAPTVNAATLLNLTSATPLTVANDNTGTVSTISGTALNLASATGSTINVTGNSLNDLLITALISSAGTITKTGAGSLLLPNADTNALTWALNGGSIFVNNATSLGTSTAAGALSFSGTIGLASASTSNTVIALQTVFTGPTNLTLGGQHPNANVTLSGAMNLNGQAPTFTVPALVSTNTITGKISGTGGFTKAGPGILIVTPGASSDFTGPVSVTGGLLTEGNANAFGGAGNNGADFTVAAGAELNMNAFALSVGSLSGGGIVTNPGVAQALTIGSGANGTNATFSGSLTAATQANLSLVKAGTNNQTLSGTSYYTGVTTVSSGTLTLKNGSTAATTLTLNNTAITVASTATLAVSAAGAVAGSINTVNIGDLAGAAGGATVTLSSGSSFSMSDNAVGIFNIQQGAAFAGTALTIGTTGAPVNLSFDLGPTSVDRLNVTKAISVGTAGGNITFTAAGSNVTPGAYVFLSASAGLNTNLSLVNTTINAGGHTYPLSITGTPTTESVIIGAQTSTLANAYYTGARGTALNAYTSGGGTNFSTQQTGGVDPGVLPAFDTNVFFSATGATNQNAVLGENFSINSLTFNAASASAISVSGNNLTINATAANGNTAGNGINVVSGNGPVTINSSLVLGNDQTWTNNSANTLIIASATVTGAGKNLTVTGTGDTIVGGAIATTSGSVTKAGAGTLTLNGNNTYTGPTGITGGKLIFGALDANANALTLANNTTAEVAASPMPAADATMKLLKAASLALTGNATLDLMNNALAVSYPAGMSSFASIDAALTSGFANGLWNGTGLKSSVAATDLTYGVPYITALGVVDNATANYGTFLGRPVDPNSVLVRYTLYGDANLDGAVTSADYTRIDSAYLALQNSQPQAINWLNGDFDYNGTIDGADYALIDTAYAFSHPGVGGAPMAQQHEAEFGAVYTDTVASLEAGHGAMNVPEPGSFALMGAGALLVGLRRRRSR